MPSSKKRPVKPPQAYLTSRPSKYEQTLLALKQRLVQKYQAQGTPGTLENPKPPKKFGKGFLGSKGRSPD